MIKLPKKLTVICDQVVDHVHKDTPLPEDMEELVNWYETDGWDDLIMGQDYAPGILDLENFSQLKFSDEEMLAYESTNHLLRIGFGFCTLGSKLRIHLKRWMSTVYLTFTS